MARTPRHIFDFGRLARARRLHLRIAQAHLAKRLGASPNYLHDVEQGKRPGVSLDFALRLASALRIAAIEIPDNLGDASC